MQNVNCWYDILRGGKTRLSIGNLLGVLQHRQALRVARTVVAHAPLQPFNGLDVVRKHVQSRERDFLRKG